ncbi:hypothetical protein BXP70_11480 [Hymenobacter crusticola]|uniref:Uncharacterized protein n=1 Tax=Hymenobacter crusticola TaxID=1770526 RepID=A0A243WFB8_9BACT|nr:hypothetical protein BXP70_11480 [Hymenobacter crusticola]
MKELLELGGKYGSQKKSGHDKNQSAGMTFVLAGRLTPRPPLRKGEGGAERKKLGMMSTNS